MHEGRKRRKIRKRLHEYISPLHRIQKLNSSLIQASSNNTAAPPVTKAIVEKLIPGRKAAWLLGFEATGACAMEGEGAGPGDDDGDGDDSGVAAGGAGGEVEEDGPELGLRLGPGLDGVVGEETGEVAGGGAAMEGGGEVAVEGAEEGAWAEDNVATRARDMSSTSMARASAMALQ